MKIIWEWLDNKLYGASLLSSFLGIPTFPIVKVNYMAVSENRGTPKSSILIGFSIINHPFWGTHIFGNTHIQEVFFFFVPKNPIQLKQSEKRFLAHKNWRRNMGLYEVLT